MSDNSSIRERLNKVSKHFENVANGTEELYTEADLKRFNDEYNSAISNVNSLFDDYNNNKYNSYSSYYKTVTDNLKNRLQTAVNYMKKQKSSVDYTSLEKMTSNLGSASEQVGSLSKFYSQFKNEDDYYNWSYSKKYKGKSVSEIDSILADTTALRGSDDKREREWLKSNRDTFMTTDEIQSEIGSLEKQSEKQRKSKNISTFGFVGGALASGFYDNDENDGALLSDNTMELYDNKREADASLTETNARLRRLKTMLTEREDFDAQKAYEEADEHNIFDVLSPDYSYSDYKNDKESKRIYGNAVVSRTDEKNLEKIDSDSELKSDLEKYKYYSDLLDTQPANSSAAIKAVSKADEIREKWTSGGYDFGSLYNSYVRRSNAETTEDMEKQMQEITDEYPVLANIASVGTNFFGGMTALPDALSSGLKDLISDDIVTLDTNSPAWALKNATDTIRSTTTEKIEEGKYGNLRSFLYSNGMSTADFLATTAAAGLSGPVSLAVMSTNSAVDEMKDVAERGGTVGEALTTGIAAGIFEALFEKVSVENLFRSVNTTSGKKLLYNIIKGFVGEGSEELCTDIANTAADAIINGNNSEFNNSVINYMADGYEPAEAKSKALLDSMKGMGLSFAGGALSGGLISSVGGGIGLARANNAYGSLGKSVMEEGGTDALMQLARETAEGSSDIQYDLDTIEKRSENAYGKEYKKQSDIILKDAAKERLTELGVPESETDNAARDIIKAYNKGKSEILQSDISVDDKYKKKVSRVYSELLRSNTAKGANNYSNAWAVEAQEGARTKARESTKDKYKASDIGRLYADTENEASKRTENSYAESLKSDIKNRLSQLGMDESTINRGADIVYKAVQNEKLTARENNILNKNPYLARAYAEIFTSETDFGRENYTNEWAVKAYENAENAASSEMKKTYDSRMNSVRAENAAKKKAQEMSENENAENRAVINESGESVTIDDIIGKTDSGIVVRLDDGSEAVISDGKAAPDGTQTVTLSNPEAKHIMNLASSYKSALTIKSFTQNIKQGQNLEAYTRDFNTAYTQGLRNNRLNTKNFTISDEQARAAYVAGKGDATVTLDETGGSARVDGMKLIDAIKRTSYESGVTRLDSSAALKYGTEAQLEVLDAYGKKYGISFITVDTLKTQGGFAANGFHEAGSNKIIIALDAENGAILSVAGHEVFHYIMEKSPSDGKILRDYVIGELKKNAKYDYEARFKELSELYGTGDADVINEEIAANAMFDVLADEKTIESLGRENPSLLKRVKSAVERFIEKIKEAVGQIGKSWREAAALNDDIKTLENIRSMFDAAMWKISENKNTARTDSEVKYSLNADFEHQYDQWDKKNPRISFTVGTTSKVLQSLGVPNQKITWDSSKIIKTKSKHPEMTDSVIKQVPNIIDNPVIVMRSRVSDSRLTLFGEVYSNNKPVLAVLELSPSGRNGVMLDELKIASAYGKDNAQRFIAGSDILYIDKNKKRVSNWEMRTGLRLPVGDSVSNSNNSISQNKSAVNNNDTQKGKNNSPKFSLKKDSGGKVFVDVNTDAVNINDGRSMASVIAEIISERFNNLIDANGQKIRINSKTNREWQNSLDARKLLKNTPDAYYDKLKSIANADEILSAAKDWVGEELKHGRNDDIVEFSRGIINYRVGKNGYSADVIVGTKSDGSALLYDLIDIKSKKITEPSTVSSSGETLASSLADSSADNNISQTGEDVKHKFSLKENQDIIAEHERILRENEELRTANQILREEFKRTDGHTFGTKARNNTRTIAKRLIRAYKSDIDAESTQNKIYSVFEYLAANGDVKGATESLIEIGTEVIERSKLPSSELNSPQLRELKKELRENPVRLNSDTKDKVADYYGGYENFRKMMWGKIRLVSDPDAPTLDYIWSDIASRYGELFTAEDENLPDTEQIDRLVEVLSTPVYYEINGMSGADIYEASAAFAYDAIDEFMKYVTPTFADKRAYQAEKKYNEALKKAKERQKEIIRAKNEKIEETKQYYRDMMKEQSEKRADTAKRASLRAGVMRKVKNMDSMLASPNDKRHIPEKLKRLISDYASLFDGGYIKVDENTIRRITDEYEALMSEDEGGEMYDADITEKLSELTDIAKKAPYGTNLVKLTTAETQLIEDITDHFTKLIRDTNTMFFDGKRQNRTQIAQRALSEVSSAGTKATKGAFRVMEKNTTPYYFFKRLGNTFDTAWGDVLYGQHQWGLKMAQSHDYLSEINKKYDIDSWKDDDKKSISFTAESGEKVEFTVNEALGIYAIAKREATNGMESKHLSVGGVVFREKRSKAAELRGKAPKLSETPKQLSLKDVSTLTSKLTKQQIAYADALIEYLSTTVAAWGNEASMRMYGYNKFTEKNYYPFHTDKNYLEAMSQDGNKQKNTPDMIKSKSFTKATVKGAATPVVAENFTDVCAAHINEMIVYNTLAEAQHNLVSLFNYKTKGTVGSPSVSMQSALEASFGEGSKDYYRQIIIDMNGGTRSDPSEKPMARMLSAFKKNAVAMNLSVVVQQPAAIARAMALVDFKYFLTSAKKNGYEELKKYSGVAVIKEMGRFDTDTGMSNAEYLMKSDIKGVANKAKALVNIKDSSYRDDVMGYAAGKADEITWNHIWQAVKKEVHDQKGLTGEELLVAAGQRFNEVIEATQVYDSVLTRSQLMRSRSTTVKMATAFMAEPIKTVNLLYQAVFQVRNNNTAESRKYLRNAIGGAVASSFLTAVFKSIVTAGRDDDEYQSQTEKYVEAVVNNLLSELSVLQKLPLVKDVVSIIQGYDISRTDMDMIDELVNSIVKVVNLFSNSFYLKTETEQKKEIRNTITNLFGTLGAFFGVPVKNVIRDMSGIVRSVKGIFDGNKPTLKGVGYSSLDALIDAFDNKMYNPFEKLRTDENDIYKSMLDGDDEKFAETWDKYEAYLIYLGKDEEQAYRQVRTNVKNKLKSEVLRGDVSDSDAEKMLIDYLDDDNGYWTVKQWHFDNDETNEGQSFSKYNSLKEAVLGGKDISSQVKELTEHNTKENSVRTEVTAIIEEAYENDEISIEKAQELLTRYKGFAAKQSITTSTIEEDKDVLRLADKWEGNKDLPDGEYYTAYDALDTAVLEGTSAESAREKLRELEYTDSDIKARIVSTVKTAYNDGEMSAAAAKSKLQKYAEYTAEDADNKIKVWDFKEKNPDCELSDDVILKYIGISGSGISLSVFDDYYQRQKECTGTKDENGKTISGSKKAQILEVINSLPISSKQKDELYYLNNYSESKLYEAPWH